MDDSWQLRACSNRSSSQYFPVAASRNQVDMSCGQYSHPYVAQEVCVIERTIRQEPMATNTLNFGSPGFSSKMARPDLGNSFLALLSGPAQQVRSDYQQSLCSRSAVVAGNSPFYQVGTLESGVWPPLTPLNVSSIGQMNGYGGFGSGLELSQAAVSRELPACSNSRGNTFQDNFDPGNYRPHGSDILKQGLRQNPQDSDPELQASVPQWLTGATNLRQQQVQGMQSLRLSKPFPETGYNAAEQFLSVVKSRPRVFCISASGMISGELVLSDTGRFGVVCACHNLHMSVAKFSEHAGSCVGNPGIAVRMESGETIIQWRKAFFLQFGVKIPDDEIGWDWNDVLASEVGLAKHRTAASHNVDKDVISSYQVDHSTVKARIAQSWNNSAYRNNSYEGQAAQGLPGGVCLQNAAPKNMHEIREALLKSFNRACKDGVPTAMNPPTSERLKDNLARAPDISGNSSYRGVPSYGNSSVGEYIDFINNGVQPFIPSQGAAGIKNFQKVLSLNRCSNIQELFPPEKDSLSSNFELRLGQPSQQTHALGTPMPSSLDSQASHAAMEREKSLMYERVLNRVGDPGLAEGGQQNVPCTLPGFSVSKEKEKERQYDNQSHGHGRTNMVETGYMDHLKGDSVRASIMSMFLQPGGHSDGCAEEVPSQTANKVLVDPEQFVSKLACLNADLHSMKRDVGEGFRSRVMGTPNKACIPSTECGPHSREPKIGMAAGPGIIFDTLASSAALFQMKHRIDNRLLHEVIPGPCLPLDTTMHDKHSFTNEPQRTAVPSIDPDMRNSPNQIALSSNFGNGDSPDAFWLRAINSALSKNSGSALLSAAAQLNLPRADAAASLSKVTDVLENKVAGDVSEEQLRSMLGWGGTHSSKRNETMLNISNKEFKSVMSQEQGQLAGILGNMKMPMQRNCAQEEVKNSTSDMKQRLNQIDRHGLGAVFENIAAADQVCHDQDLSGPRENSGLLTGPSASQFNIPTLEAGNLKNSQVKEAFSHLGCSKPSSNDQPLLRLGRLSQKCVNDPTGEQAILKQKGSNQTFASEKVNQAGNIGSPVSKECSRTDALISDSKENATSAILGTTSAAVVSVGENESAVGKGSAEPNDNVERHDGRNTSSESSQWKDANGIVIAEDGVLQHENPVDAVKSRETEDLLADTAAKGSVKSLPDTGSPQKEQQMSNACSKTSDNAFSEFSDAGHVINEDTCNADSVCKKLMRSDVVDEGSGIGKCCSSDAIDTGVWARRKLPSVSMDMKNFGSTFPSPYPLSSDANVSKVRSSLRLKRVHGSAECTVAENELATSTVLRAGKLEKKKRTMKWKRLDATVPVVENNRKTSLPLNHIRHTDCSFLPSLEVVKPVRMQCGTASVSSTPIARGSTLKRKRSVLVSGNPSTSKHKECEFQGHLSKDETVQPVQVKGDKLVIRIRQASLERKEKQRDVGGLDQDFDRTGSRKVSKYAPTNSEKYLRNNNINITDGKTGVSLCGSSSALRNLKPGHGKLTSKTAKMVSLRSILKHPDRHVDNQKNDTVKLSSLEGMGNSILNRTGGNVGRVSAWQRIQSNEVQLSFEPSVGPKPQHAAKESSWLGTVKEVRKRSLWELTEKSKSENKSACVQEQHPKSAGQTVLSNLVGGECSNTHCAFPRGERTLRVRFKCKSKGSFPQPNSTLPTVSTNVFSANYHWSTKRLSQPGGVRRPKACTSETGAQTILVPAAKVNHMVSKTEENNPVEETLSSFTKAVTRKEANRAKTFCKKDNQYIDWPPANAFKKQKRVDKKEKARAYIDECPETTIGSFAGQSACKTVKIRKCSNSLLGENPGHPQSSKRCKRENPLLGPNINADAPCCVCGSSNEEGTNRLVQCGRCLTKVHQACYGVSKIPKSGWTCRACKSNLSNIACVLCGYGGGAMTRAQKTRNVVKGLLQVWQLTRDSNSKVSTGDLDPVSSNRSVTTKSSAKSMCGMPESSKTELGASGYSPPNFLSSGKHDSSKQWFETSLEDVQVNSSQREKLQRSSNVEFQVQNTITAAVNDPTVTQWVHMVCGLWMPGTRCLNVDTMGVFDVSGAALARRKLVCSICKRPGGSCIQCRAVKCSVPFHPWCAHQKGLLQSEIEGDDSEKVGFYGRCMLHGENGDIHADIDQSGDTLPVNSQTEGNKGTCARTEGYKGRKNWEELRAELRRQSDMDNTRAVSQEQINAWLHINGRKSCTKGFIKPPISDVRTDYRKEYLRFKQLQRWKRLVVYKSGIHALGLYAAEFISKGEMVVEYVGEIVGLRVADKREIDYHSGRKMQYEGACYFFRMDKESIIDATRKGGIARFVNHSCTPNCVAKVISVRSQKKVVFFAERDINAGEEITYDYHFNDEDDGKKIPCFCNSKNCRRYLN